MAQIMAYEAKIGFFFLNTFDLCNPVDSPGFENIASDRINGVGGKNNDTAIIQAFQYQPDLSV